MRRSKSGASSLLELVVIVLVALALAFAIQALLVKPYRIPSGSMEPTLAIGQRVLVNRIGNRFSSPKIGEIVVFHPPKGSDQNVQQCGIRGEGPYYQGSGSHESCSRPTAQPSSVNFIKRVVGLPGDRIGVRNGHVVRNGVLQSEKFVARCGADPSCNLDSIVVPPGEYFMMGDNRGQSEDSRYWGPEPRKWIIGGAFATYWPPDRIGFL